MDRWGITTGELNIGQKKPMRKKLITEPGRMRERPFLEGKKCGAEKAGGYTLMTHQNVRRRHREGAGIQEKEPSRDEEIPSAGLPSNWRPRAAVRRGLQLTSIGGLRTTALQKKKGVTGTRNLREGKVHYPLRRHQNQMFTRAATRRSKEEPTTWGKGWRFDKDIGGNQEPAKRAQDG